MVVLTIWSPRGWGCSTFNLCTTTFNHKPVIQVLRWESASIKISSVGLGLNAINFRQIIEGLLITAIKFIKLSRLPTHCNQTYQCQDTKTPPNVWRLQPEVQHPEALQVTERLVTLVSVRATIYGAKPPQIRKMASQKWPWGGCRSEGRAAHLLIGMLMVESAA